MISCRYVLAVLLLLPLAACAGQSGAQQPPQRYADDDRSFVMTFPASWEVRSDVPALEVVGISPRETDETPNRVGVLVEDLPEEHQLTLDEYVRVSIESGPDLLEDFVLESQSSRDLNGQEGIELVYTGRVDERSRRFLAVVVVRESRAYTVTYTADESNYTEGLDEANQVINTLVLT